MNYVKCKNYLNMNVEHYILESSSTTGKFMDRLQICGICRKRAFEDNYIRTNPEPGSKIQSYKDSKINPNSGPCGIDTL